MPQDKPPFAVVTELRRSPTTVKEFEEEFERVKKTIKDAQDVFDDVQKLFTHIRRVYTFPIHDRQVMKTLSDRIASLRLELQQIQRLTVPFPPEPVKPEQKGVEEISAA